MGDASKDVGDLKDVGGSTDLRGSKDVGCSGTGTCTGADTGTVVSAGIKVSKHDEIAALFLRDFATEELHTRDGLKASQSGTNFFLSRYRTVVNTHVDTSTILTGCDFEMSIITCANNSIKQDEVLCYVTDFDKKQNIASLKSRTSHGFEHKMDIPINKLKDWYVLSEQLQMSGSIMWIAAVIYGTQSLFAKHPTYICMTSKHDKLVVFSSHFTALDNFKFDAEKIGCIVFNKGYFNEVPKLLKFEMVAWDKISMDVYVKYVILLYEERNLYPTHINWFLRLSMEDSVNFNELHGEIYTDQRVQDYLSVTFKDKLFIVQKTWKKDFLNYLISVL